MKTITDESGTYTLEDVGDESFDIPYLAAGFDRNWDVRMEQVGKHAAKLFQKVLDDHRDR